MSFDGKRSAEDDALLRMDAYVHQMCRGEALDNALASNRRLIAGIRKDAIRDAALWLSAESNRVRATGREWRRAAVKINPDHASSPNIISYWNREKG